MSRTDRPGLAPEHMLCFDVHALGQAFNRLYRPLLGPLGLTYPQYLVMILLWAEAPVTAGGIAARLGLETSTITPLLKRLEAAGLVTRRRSALDERRVEVDLSPRGRAMQGEAAHIPACVEAAIGLDRAGIDDLRARLGRLRQAFGSP